MKRTNKRDTKRKAIIKNILAIMVGVVGTYTTKMFKQNSCYISETELDNNSFTSELRVEIPGQKPFYLSREGTNYVPYVALTNVDLRIKDSQLELQ